MRKLIFSVIFILITSIIDAQIIKDSIICGKYILTIDVADIGYRYSKIDNYEEGFFKTYPNMDSSYLLIMYGSMISLPILKDKDNWQEYNKYEMNNNIISMRGLCENRYCREDIYYKQNIVVLYENIDKSNHLFYDSIMNNIVIKEICK